MKQFMEKNEAKKILATLIEMYPDAKCELEHKNAFELLIAVSLSAQTTDKRVNIVTKELFQKYKDPYMLKDAKYEDVYEIIKSLGLAKVKANNIINLSASLVKDFDGKVPSTRDELCSLVGVGRKTANVVLSVWFKENALAVDTHVARVSKRLGFTINDDPLKIEKDLMELFEQNSWYKLHHVLIFFGRYFCKAVNPMCTSCPFKNICKEKNQE